MSAVDITMIYCLCRVTDFTTALQIMNVKGVIKFIYSQHGQGDESRE